MKFDESVENKENTQKPSEFVERMAYIYAHICISKRIFQHDCRNIESQHY